MKRFVPVMMAAVYLAACGAPSPASASTVKSVTAVAAPDAAEVADGATRSAAATEVSQSRPTVAHPSNRVPVTAASTRPAAPLPVADPDRGTAGFSCMGFGAPGKIKVMCAPQSAPTSLASVSSTT